MKSRQPSSTQASPTSSPKKPTLKRAHPQKIDDARSIHAFFTPQNHAWRSRDEPQHERLFSEAEDEEKEDDLIEDDSYDEGFRKLPTRQITKTSVLDRRKRHLAPTQSRATSTSLEKIQNASQKFKIPQKVSLQHSLKNSLAASSPADLRPWTERYGPRDLDELMVHKKKVADVQKWLENCRQGQDQKILLVLKGPSGAGKTATIAALAKAMNLDVSEWKNPIDTNFASEGYLSMSSQFEDFLGRSGKFGSLALTGSSPGQNPVSSVLEPQMEKKKIILMEEFPNTFTRTSTALKSFRLSILNYLAENTPAGPFFSRQQSLSINASPLVMIITETHLAQPGSFDDNLSAHRLLGPDILNHPGVSIIEFNPIAPTFLMKALDLVIQKEARQTGRRRVPGASVLKKLSEVGDVRSAITSLEFLCLKDEDGDGWGGTVASRAKTGPSSASALTKVEKKSLEMVTQREANLGIFHAVAKVVYNKREQTNTAYSNAEPVTQPPDHLSQYARPKASQVSVEELMNETGADIQTFIAALHENYVLSCEGPTFIDSINGCIDALSDSDLLCSGRGGRFSSGGLGAGLSRAPYQGVASDSMRQDEVCFHVAVRGLLFELPDLVKRHAPPAGVAGRKGGKGDAFKMFFPTSLRLSKRMEEIESLADQWTRRCGADLTLSEPALGKGYDPGFVALRGGNLQSPVLSNSVFGRTQDTGGIKMTKTDLILETLPYVAKIASCNPSHFHGLGELKRIIQHCGMDPANDQLSDDDRDEMDSSISAVNSTIEPRRRDVDSCSKNSVRLVLSAEIGLGKLYLSDDEIEDD